MRIVYQECQPLTLAIRNVGFGAKLKVIEY